MTTTKILGNAVLLKMDGTLLGAQRNASLDISSSEIDVSDKTSGGWDVFLVGNRSWEMSCEAIAVAGDEIQDAIITKTMEGETIQIIFEHGSAAVYSGSAVITSCSLSGDKGDVSTASFSLKGASALSKSSIPVFSSQLVSDANTVNTITFNAKVANNLVSDAALKAAIYFAADGETFVGLQTEDTVEIVSGKLVITFDTAFTGSLNRLKIAAGSLKVVDGTISNNEIITRAFAAA
jgi:predicted secreted protein